MSSPSRPAVEVSALSKQFGATQVLKSVSLKIPPGDVLAVLGPSGSGKSTMLRCLNLLETPDGGRISVFGSTVEYTATAKPSAREIAELRSHTGMVFQHFDLFPHMTVLGNIIEAPIIVKKVPRKQAIEEAMALLTTVGLANKADAYPRQLSGGQKHRVAIARALAMKPEVLLLDEVTSALDPELVGEVLGVVRRLASTGMTMVLVTHEIAFARDVATTVAFMDGGEIQNIGTPAEILDGPSAPRLAAFLSRFKAQVWK